MIVHIFCLIINVFDYQTYIRKTIINDMIIKVLDDIMIYVLILLSMLSARILSMLDCARWSVLILLSMLSARILSMLDCAR